MSEKAKQHAEIDSERDVLAKMRIVDMMHSGDAIQSWAQDFRRKLAAMRNAQGGIGWPPKR